MQWLLWRFCLLAESYETINHVHVQYNKADERILNILKQFDTRAPLECLRGLAHNYDINGSFIMFSNFHPLFTVTNLSVSHFHYTLVRTDWRQKAPDLNYGGSRKICNRIWKLMFCYIMFSTLNLCKPCPPMDSRIDISSKISNCYSVLLIGLFLAFLEQRLLHDIRFVGTAIGGRTKLQICFLPWRLRWPLFLMSAKAIHPVAVVAAFFQELIDAQKNRNLSKFN